VRGSAVALAGDLTVHPPAEVARPR
jgi:hypothetical protein